MKALDIYTIYEYVIHGQFDNVYIPRCDTKFTSSSGSHFQAQTVKNRSICSSNACCPSVVKIEANEP